MNTEASSKITLAAAFCGAMTILLGIIMLFTFPSSAELREGFHTPIIAFEFAKTESDVAFLAGLGEESRINREKMDAGHVWDMFFPFAYGGFLAFLMLQLSARGVSFLKFGVIVALAIVPFDINENFKLLAITSALDSGSSIDTLLTELDIATWLKWGAIGISIGLIAVGYTLKKEYLSALPSYLASLSILAGWLSDAEPTTTEVMSALTFIFFLWFAIKEIREAFKIRRTERETLEAAQG